MTSPDKDLAQQGWDMKLVKGEQYIHIMVNKGLIGAELVKEWNIDGEVRQGCEHYTSKAALKKGLKDLIERWQEEGYAISGVSASAKTVFFDVLTFSKI